jgi:hypothetical protein
VKEDEMGRACTKHGGEEERIRVLVEKPEEINRKT